MNLFSPETNGKETQGGAALIIVLSVLVLLTAVIVMFMTASRNDLSATMQYAAGQEALALSETATNLVMSQIREATLAGIDSEGAGTHAWASQPGAIRVWDQDGKPASPYLYKLYSAARMKEASMGFLSTEVPSDWRSKADVYVDLNEPVKQSGEWRFPILNPRGLEGSTSPATSGSTGIAGFSSSVPRETDIPWDTRASMPVRWLYISENGEITEEAEAKSVGRIAFWTDDETSKVNVNTASFTQVNRTVTSGTSVPCSFWDLPQTRMAQDYSMGRTPPAQDEFQRYPGHPASVNLGAVLKLDTDFTLEKAFSLPPRYKWGGSRNGVRNTKDSPDAVNAPEDRIAGKNRKQDRLYASVDELVFGSSRTKQASYPTRPGFTQEQLTDYYRFFLTSTSRSPDLNLFGGPKVGLWPVHKDDSELTRTVYDKLIVRCNTVGSLGSGFSYFFQRYDPLSQINDWLNIERNQEIFEYLQKATSRLIPGFGGQSFHDKYDSTATKGASGERDQILTQMFDYIRCVNLNETYPDLPPDFQRYTPALTNPNYSGAESDALDGAWLTNNPSLYAGAGFVLPIRIDSLNTRGMGRVPTLSEVGLLFLAKQGDGNQDHIHSFLLTEASTPMMGYMPWIPPRRFSIRVTGSVRSLVAGETEQDIPVPTLLHVGGGSNPSIIRQPIFPNINLGGAVIPSFDNPYAGRRGYTVGGPLGPGWMAPLAGSVTSSDLKVDGVNYPFYVSAADATQFPGSTLQLYGGTLKIEYGIDDVPFQTFTINIPDSNSIPRPTPAEAHIAFNAGNYTRGYKFQPNHDVVRSVLLRDGDLRITACLQDVPSSFFMPHSDFNNVLKKQANTFRLRTNYVYKNAVFGGLIRNESATSETAGYYTGSLNSITGDPAIYSIDVHPDIDPSITDLRLQKGWTGDWTNGVGNLPDGAHVLKSDEGYTHASGTAPPYFNELSWSPAGGFFSPIRQIPSAGLFGTLPSGVKKTEKAYINNQPEDAAPWRTLLFCPNPDAGKSHFGFTAPADHLWLDLFHTPVVEPYAISEPLSTAGRINMNSQILPFTKIVRDTGLHAVLSSQKVTALPASLANVYKMTESLAIYRYRVNAVETLKQFHERFAPGGDTEAGDLFRSPSEICSIYLVPNTHSAVATDGVSGPTLASSDIEWNGTSLNVAKMAKWWEDYRLTGDALRERPYALMYPLLTTKSNTYTVHIIAQSLTVKPDGADSFRTIVKGEYRGSTTIERYIDPADSRIGIGTGEYNPDGQSLEPLYRFRVVDTKRFAP
jgi:hypothetical protein